MRKNTVTLILLLPSFAFAQSVYMHEAQDDAANSEPISILGIITFLAIVGLIYIIVKVVKGEKHNREKRKQVTDAKESDHKNTTIKAGGFICPFCGKHVMDNNYQTIKRYFDGEGYKIKYCKACEERYNQYEIDRLKYKRKELPDWVGITLLILLIVIGLVTLIINCIKGNVFDGILGMFFVPLAVFFILGVPIAIFSKIIEKPEPTEPFKTPTLQHIRDCNAIHMTFDDYKRAIEKELNKRNYNQVENKKLMSESEHIITECFEKKQSITLAVLALGGYGYSK